MLADVFVIACLVVATLLIGYIFFAHRGHPDFSKTDRHPKLVGLLYAIQFDRSFEKICKKYCRLTPDQAAELYEFIKNKDTLRVVSQTVLLGGWVGRVPGQDYYGLALPARLWPFLLWTIAVHEYFHIVRHIQGIVPFESEQRFWLLHPYRVFCLGIIEEFIIWRKTARVDQIGTLMLVTPVISAAIMMILSMFLVFQHDFPWMFHK